MLAIAVHGGAGIAAPRRAHYGEEAGVPGGTRGRAACGLRSSRAPQQQSRCGRRRGASARGRSAVQRRPRRSLRGEWNDRTRRVADGTARRCAPEPLRVRHVRSPIELARRVLEHSPRDARRPGPARSSRSSRAWHRCRTASSRPTIGGSSSSAFFMASRPGRNRSPAVGAVALDVHGNLAAATSTGGLTVSAGDVSAISPIIGAGTYAANDACAVSATGHGNTSSALPPHEIAALIRYGVSASPRRRPRCYGASVSWAVTAG